MNKPNYRPSTGTKSRTKIPKGFWLALGIILVSSLPYLNEVLTVKTEGGAAWSHLFGLNRFLPDAETGVLGFSGYRMFLYTFFIFVFTTLGWSVWFLAAKNKLYRKALLIPAALGLYQIVMILGGLRSTIVNSWEVKTGIILLMAVVLVVSQSKQKRFDISLALKWMLLIGVTTLPFFHDIITEKSTASLRVWVPNLGIENLLSGSQNNVLGFGTYRAFIYFFMLHLYAHLGWLGSFVYYHHARKGIRPFLLVPVIISLFSLILFILNKQETPFGAPDIKFYITIALSTLLAWNFFFNNKTGRSEELETNKTM